MILILLFIGEMVVVLTIINRPPFLFITLYLEED